LCLLYMFVCFFFFFQAEDGIRDRNVTGVQTCALPISSAVWLLNELGLGFSEKYLNKMDITIDKKKDGLGVALGGLTDGLTPLQIAQAYTIFGNQGTMTEAHVISEIKD